MVGSQYPPIELISQVLIYQDGSVYWRERPREHFADERAWKIWHTRFAGNEAGNYRFFKHSNEYRCIVGLSYTLILRSIIVWAIHKQEWPAFDLDHEDHDTLNDRIENLRLATESQNGGNQLRAKNNTSGYKGVSWDYVNSRWRAKIQVNGKTIHLGRFNTMEEARDAYREAAIKYFGEFACFM